MSSTIGRLHKPLNFRLPFWDYYYHDIFNSSYHKCSLLKRCRSKKMLNIC